MKWKVSFSKLILLLLFFSQENISAEVIADKSNPVFKFLMLTNNPSSKKIVT